MLLYVTGWGRLRWRFGRGSEKLQEVQLPIVPQSQCGNLLGSSFEEQTMVCAGNVTDGGIDTCQVLSLFMHSNDFFPNFCDCIDASRY